jgi:hypothetical protein
MVDRYVDDNGVRRLATADELAEINARETAWNNDAPNRKLAEIKQIRLEKLKETDYLANSDVTMPDNVKTWRQTLRDLPANHTDEAAYDALLARDKNGNLTHSVWSKP